MESLHTSVGVGQPNTMHQEHHCTQAGASYDASLLCKVEHVEHEVEETIPPLDTQYLSHPRDEIGVVDSIEVVDMDPRDMASPYHQYSGALVVLWIARSTTTLLLHALHSRRAACVVRYFGTV